MNDPFTTCIQIYMEMRNYLFCHIPKWGGNLPTAIKKYGWVSFAIELITNPDY